MSLFRSLPAPVGNKRQVEDPSADDDERSKRLKPEDKPAAAHQEANQATIMGQTAAEQQPEAEQGAQQETHHERQQQPLSSAAPPPPPPAPVQCSTDPVAAALRKIAVHIAQPRKFVKAAELLRQLFGQEGTLRHAEHGPLAFSALKASMRDPQQAHDPLLAREYSKLFMAASKHAEIFTLRELSQLDVYGTWAVLRNQLTTDDSFQFNKVVGRLKDMAEALPEASEEDDEILIRLQEKATDPDPILQDSSEEVAGPSSFGPAGEAMPTASAAGPTVGPASEAGAAAAGTVATAHQPQAQQQPEQPAGEEPVEHDPFGLDKLLAEAPAAPPPPPPPPSPPRAPAPSARRKSVTWSSREVENQRRVALLDCVDTCRACYRHAWARTSVDLLIEHFHKLSDRFAPRQRPRLEDAMRFVRDQRRIRKLGPSAKEVARDLTSFEAARAEWSKQTVSHRGKVGSRGDHKAEQWLG